MEILVGGGLPRRLALGGLDRGARSAYLLISAPESYARPMAHEAQAPRRGFLGTMLAAISAACLPWRAADQRARWEDPVAQPGGHARLEVLAAAPRARVVLVITTPREVIRRPLGSLSLVGGRGALEVALEYPYDSRVVGEYTYRAEVRVDAQVLTTARPVRYRIGEPSCFA